VELLISIIEMFPLFPETPSETGRYLRLLKPYCTIQYVFLLFFIIGRFPTRREDHNHGTTVAFVHIKYLIFARVLCTSSEYSTTSNRVELIILCFTVVVSTNDNTKGNTVVAAQWYNSSILLLLPCCNRSPCCCTRVPNTIVVSPT
jgi:hypothetical protein